MRTEIEEQCVVVEYCEYMKIPVYHVPNEGKRSYGTAALLRRAGLRRGVPDLCIPLARGGKHGLYIELKVGGNKPTLEQKEWLRLLVSEGYAVAVCYGADSAIKTIEEYMRENERQNQNGTVL